MAKCVRLLAVALLGIATIAGVSAAPFTPDDDAVILERLPEVRDPALTALKKLRTVQRARPDDLRIATTFARRAIDASRATGDPRWLGQAHAALAPWWAAPNAPDSAVLLRATIKQAQHDFDGALVDLDRLVDRRSDAAAQARLTRATVRTVVGRHAEALADCAVLSPRVAPVVAAGCRAGALSQTGFAAEAARGLDVALAESGVPPALRAWALTLAAEIAQRDGDAVGAETRFTEALAIDPHDQYLRGAYADFLLDYGRAAEVVSLLRDDTRNDALLLRLTLAEARLPAEGTAFSAHRAELAARFAATRLRGDTLHRREEARYALVLERDPVRAVTLAKANFALQREPADLRILAESGAAANDAAALATARDWQARTGAMDPAATAALGGRR